MSEQPHESLDERLLHRLLFFSDAVFAIVLTLLALELKPPGAEGSHGGYGGLILHLLAFTGSFALVGIFWIAHMNITRQLVRFDWTVAVLNLFFLLPVCLIPFVSAWVGAGGAGAAGAESWLAYCVVLVMTSVMSVVLVVAATRGGGHLMVHPVVGRDRLYRIARAAIPGVAFTFGIIALLAGLRMWSFNCWVLIPLLFFVVGRTLKPKASPAA